MLASKEVYNWYVADLNKIINWKNFKADGVTPARKNELLVLWDLVRGVPKPTPSKRTKEDMDMDRRVESDSNKNLYKGNKQY